MPSYHLQAFDAQRFDLSRRRMRSVPNIQSSAAISRPKSTSEFSDSSFLTSSPMPVVSGPWPDHSLAILSNEESSDSGNTSDAEDLVSHTPDLSTSRATSPMNTSEGSITLEGDEPGGNVKEVVQTDVFEKEDFTITRTIIRPKPSRSVLSIFSRPSSPLDPTSRPGTPLGINFKALNCITASHAFEEEVDYLQLEREREHELHIRVFQEQSVHNEESWRGPLQRFLYREHPIPANVGRVETH